MSSESGHEPSGPPGGWGPPGLPSRWPTVLVTAFFGLFGLIPATRGSRRAEQLGVSGSRYFTAFGITFGTAALVWACIATVVLVTVVGNGDPAESLAATGGSTAKPDKAKGQQVDGQWTVEGLLPALQGFANDEYSEDDEDYGFTEGWGALVPCGGQGDQGLAPDVLETTIGGYSTVASAQVLPSSASAERELARQTAILEDCTAGYVFTSEDGGDATCSPSIQTSTPVVRYREDCDGFAPYIVAIFRADNAVITVLTGDNSTMDWMLPSIMGELDAD